MRRFKQHRWTLVQTALASMIVAALGATIVAAAYDYDQEDQQGWQQQQYQNRQPSQSMQDQGSWQQQGQRSGMMQGRNQQIERQVANQLRQEGFGQEGQIMVLAVGNRVILLGTVPEQNQKQQIGQVTNQVPGVQQVDNRLQVSQGTGRMNDSQLQQRIQQQLRSQTSAGRNIQVQARNGRVTLNGQVNDWQEMADVLEAAFAAGAQNVTSQLSTAGQSQYGMGQDQRRGRQDTGQYGYDQQGAAPPDRRYGRGGQMYGEEYQQTDEDYQTDRGYYPPYGYTPGQEDQTQWQDRQRQQGRMQQDQQQWDQQQRGMRSQQRGRQPMSASDLTLAQRIAMQLQQQLRTDKTIHVMDPQAIYVHVSQGTVMLHGSVQDNNQRQQAEQIARSVRGVQNVRNQLQVAGQGGEFQTFGYVPGQMDQSRQQDRSRTDSQSQWDSSSRQGQSSTGADQSTDTFSSGSSADSQSQSYGQQSQTGQQQMSAADKQLAQQVQQQLQKQLPQANIHVMASQGTITLHGSVQDQNQKQQAEQAAKNISGVKDVQNQINVGDFPALGYIPGQDRQRQQMGRQPGGVSDAVLAHQIAMQLQQQLDTDQVVHVMDPQAIYIHVSQGTVTLHGSVQDQNQSQQAEQIIQNIRGVQNVQNELEVAGQQWQQQQMGQQTGQQPMGQQQMTASDRQLSQQVQQRLQQQLRQANINVMASQGTVTLQGSVQDQNQKQQAEQIARSIPGVQNVRNNITVGGEAGAYPPLGYIPGQEGQAQQQDTGTGISGDTQCIQIFKQGLTDQNLQSMAQNVYVTCREGKMALYGYVKSDDEKNQLEKMTKKIPGIKEVDNSLMVHKEGWKQKSDAEIQQDVESQLWWSPYVDSDKINVSVQNGTVTLSGRADDWDAMRAAVKNAFDGGAKRVRSQIQYGQTGTGDQGPGQRSGTSGSMEEHPSGIDTGSNR